MIKTLKEIGTNNILYPKTDVSAVLKENGESIKANLIPDGGSQGQILQYAENGVSWDYPFKDYTNILAYGIEWDITVSDPTCTRIGNMSLHKSLPIQSQMKGCICKEGELVYWLNEKDWRFKQNPEYGSITTSVWSAIDQNIPKVGKFTGYMATAQASDFIKQANKYDMQWIKIGDLPVQICNYVYDETQETPLMAYLLCKQDPTSLGTVNGENIVFNNVEIGSCTNGYDGCVKVYVPEFYLKSEIEGNKRRVWLSTVRLDQDWIHQEALLVDAYRTTCLLTVPQNYGYLSTLKVNTLLSVANYTTSCRGGNTNNAYDKYLTGEGIDSADISPARSHICKPRTMTNITTMRTYARQSENTALLNYEQYKNILYWLFVVEYATFNSQQSFTTELTSEGLHQGGLGDGVTTTSFEVWTNLNSTYPIIPCGYTNELGNITNVRSLTIPEFKVDVPSITNFKSATIKNTTYVTKDNNNNIVITPRNTNISGAMVQMSPIQCSPTTTYKIEGLTALEQALEATYGDGKPFVTLTFYVGSFDYPIILQDGEYTINWLEKTTNYSNRAIRISLGNPNGQDFSQYPITISIVSAEAGQVINPSITFKVPKYRGIEQPFGDVYTNLDGIIIDAATHETNVDYVYTCNDPAKYADTITEDYTKIGEKIHQDGFIKYFDLQKNCNIFVTEVGGTALSYKCDRSQGGGKNTILRALLVGGRSSDGNFSGLSCLNSSNYLNNNLSYFGFRACSYPSFTL